MSKTSSLNENLADRCWVGGFIIAIIGLVVVTFSLAETREVPMTIIGAVLGVAMTACATFFLFKGQSKQELKQEKDVEIFKSRLKAYQAFLDALSSYLQTKQEVDKTKLKFHTAALAMHGDLKRLTDVNKTVKTIVDACNGGNNNDLTLIPALFHLSEIFRTELYETEIESKDYQSFIDSVNEFAASSRYADEDADEEAVAAEDAEQARQIEVAASTGVIDWDTYISSLKGWKASCKKGEIRLEKADSNIIIEFKLKSGYYVVASNDGENKEYPVELKNRIKGSYRSGSNWWRPLNTLRNYRVKAEALPDEIRTNDGARAVVINWIDKIINILND